MGKIIFNLSETISTLDITKNKLAVESKTRPATIADIVNGTTKRIELDTLVNVIDALNGIAKAKGLEKVFTVKDVFEYVEDDKEPSN